MSDGTRRASFGADTHGQFSVDVWEIKGRWKQTRQTILGEENPSMLTKHAKLNMNNLTQTTCLHLERIAKKKNPSD